MPEIPQKPGGPPTRSELRFPTPWGYFKKHRDERYRRRRTEVARYLEIATPIALDIDRLYQEWREGVTEPIQDCQKAANCSAIYWWQVAERQRRFQGVSPPDSAKKYHRLFAEALKNASAGAEVAKNGFRFNKFSEVSRGMGYLDRYLELMREAEAELGRLLREYQLIEGE